MVGGASHTLLETVKTYGPTCLAGWTPHSPPPNTTRESSNDAGQCSVRGDGGSPSASIEDHSSLSRARETVVRHLNVPPCTSVHPHTHCDIHAQTSCNRPHRLAKLHHEV